MKSAKYIPWWSQALSIQFKLTWVNLHHAGEEQTPKQTSLFIYGSNKSWSTLYAQNVTQTPQDYNNLLPDQTTMESSYTQSQSLNSIAHYVYMFLYIEQPIIIILDLTSKSFKSDLKSHISHPNKTLNWSGTRACSNNISILSWIDRKAYDERHSDYFWL